MGRPRSNKGRPPFYARGDSIRLVVHPSTRLSPVMAAEQFLPPGKLEAVRHPASGTAAVGRPIRLSTLAQGSRGSWPPSGSCRPASSRPCRPWTASVSAVRQARDCVLRGHNLRPAALHAESQPTPPRSGITPKHRRFQPALQNQKARMSTPKPEDFDHQPEPGKWFTLCRLVLYLYIRGRQGQRLLFFCVLCWRPPPDRPSRASHLRDHAGRAGVGLDGRGRRVDGK